MRIAAMLLLGLMTIGLLSACGDNATEEENVAVQTDDQLIQATLDEVVGRWHAGDKAVLYDNEFTYLREQFTFDQYLVFPQINWMNADTVGAINAQDFLYYERDSADVRVQVVLVHPVTGDTSIVGDRYRFYYHNDRWIRPTVSTTVLQWEYDRDRRVADSAAAAEAELEDM